MKRICGQDSINAYILIFSTIGDLKSSREKSFLHKLWIGLNGLYSLPTIVGCLMPNPLYTSKLNIYMVCKHIL